MARAHRPPTERPPVTAGSSRPSPVARMAAGATLTAHLSTLSGSLSAIGGIAGVGTFPGWLSLAVAPASKGLIPQPVSMSAQQFIARVIDASRRHGPRCGDFAPGRGSRSPRNGLSVTRSGVARLGTPRSSLSAAGRVPGGQPAPLGQSRPFAVRFATRLNVWGGWPNLRMNARRMRSGSAKPVSRATTSMA
jgi:hypothetical protein